jgi:predicted RNA-binding Zn ribbon-like protein
VAGDDDPVRSLATLLADALAQAMTAGGPERFGVCAADPCRCAYLDRTRAGRRRFCCQWCTDRVAAAAYRDRRDGR